MNVVVLVIDDTRWDSIGAAGNRIVRTPHLDRLANEGVRFTQARVTTSICMVSRATLLTGQHMARHGIDRVRRAAHAEAFAKTYPACCGPRDTGPATSASTASAHRGRATSTSCAPTGQHWLDGRREQSTSPRRTPATRSNSSRPAEGRPFCWCRVFRRRTPRTAPGAVPAAGLERAGYEGATMPRRRRPPKRPRRRCRRFSRAKRTKGRVRCKSGSTRPRSTRRP